MNNEDQALILQDYSKLVDGIQFFHDEQTEHRFMSSKILFGTFAIIGVLFYTKIQLSHVPVLLLSATVPLLTIVLITINFALDLIVKERLRLSCFLEAVKYERKYSWIPPFHLLMIESSKQKYYRAGYKKGTFYIGCASILMILSSISIAMMPQFSDSISRTIIAIVLFICIFFYRKFINKTASHGDLIKEINNV
jgi:hypothetical protein